MKIIGCLFLLFFSIRLCCAQCLSGDCKDGFGKFDYGYAIYTGNFVNSKPDGKGTMDYGGGDRFEGSFTQGQENGKGILYKKNIADPVTYINGKVKLNKPVESVGSNAPKIDGCIKGDCYNGYGELQFFASGNVFRGNFEYGNLQGPGVFYFKSGNVLKANYKDGKPTTGELKYSTGELFTGTFNEDGSPRTGKYAMNAEGDMVEIKDNVIAYVKSIAGEKIKQDAAAKAEHAKNYKTCPKCGGAGGEMVRDSWKSSKKTYSGTIYDEFEITTNYGPPRGQKCFYCNGKGEVKR